jgi:sensor c-di-GMP phosphodiesterase-like protein
LNGGGSLSSEVAGEVIEELNGQLSVQARAQKRHASRKKRIQHAIEDEGALEMVFQPIVALHGRKVVGWETLARFKGPPQRTPDVWFAEATTVGLGAELELVSAEGGRGVTPSST